ncbi:MAG TPA: VWA domain-containing protein [Caldithrix abyssi]|uniref:VWA domain-containing protein n=1 Tax=Caldithrix abyssi TaxID=187145 RepID=A0A7V4WVQ1_CALAY|nr:VWA domain-containing protein [Caldithrix abyssi]
MKRFFSFALVLFSITALHAQGRLIIERPPRNFSSDQVYLKEVNGRIYLNNGAGEITLQQIFFNQSNHRLEGTYLFPLPKDARLSDFYLYINGKKTRGQLLDGDKARQTYQQIVRSMRDPALLEYSRQNLFKARIFPIEPQKERKIELSYVQTLTFDNDTYRFTVPLRQSGQGKIERFQLKIELQSDQPIAQVYSPSHRIQVDRQDRKHFTITVDEVNLAGDKDFILYYSLVKNEVNASLITFRPRTDRDGYFLLMMRPDIDQRQTKTIAKDVIFVIDNSGSMSGEKIEQARQALRFCLNTLDSRDRFAIIGFSSGINAFQRRLVRADSEQKQNAAYFIDNLSANGGTNIDAALQYALKMKDSDDGRSTSIVFLTDGLPTEGETGLGRILQNVAAAGKSFYRIFSFGVGYDVNTFLLDKLSEDQHGTSAYVKPGENIETEISSLFAKISSPLLMDVQVHFSGGDVYDIYPKTLPDFFAGQRVLVFGRYRTPGAVTVTLQGRQGEKTRRFSYEMQFGRRVTDNDFVSKLWANRKVAYLLQQIRFNGENPEWVASVKALGEEYGLVTPYTSYLVTEQRKELVRAQSASAPAMQRLRSKQQAMDLQAEADEESAGSQVFFDALASQPLAASASSGKKAVMSSRIMKKVASAEREQEMLITMRRINGKTFYLKNGVWTEQGLPQPQRIDKKLTFLSDAYFAFLAQNPQAGKILALGEKVIFNWKGKVYEIAASF